LKKRKTNVLRAFLGILVATALVLLLAAALNLLVMPLVVRKGWEVTVPDLVGLSRLDAERELARVGLELGSVRVVSSTVAAAGHIVSQTPRPGRRVKRSRSVDIDVAGDNSRVTVPEVIGLPTAKAMAVLELAGLSVARIESLRSPGIPSGQVVRVVPPPGAAATRETKVVIAVSTRTGVFPMPSLVGMDKETAQGIVVSQGLVVGSVKPAVSSERIGSVLFQFPEEGTAVSEGDTVSLIVAAPQQQ